MKLQEYKRKRNFRQSPEPRGKIKKSGNIYVIQKHDASHLHYDLRLQLDGVLKSWAVPKGPSLDPSQKRLAMQVEDHPVDYATFEGVIPSGYGAGEVIVWDYGTWDSADGRDARQALKKGHLDFEIHGEKLHGRWMLLRTKRGDPRKPQWLLMKRKDGDAKKESDYVVTEEEKESVLSGRKLERDEERKPAMKTPRKKKARKAVTTKSTLPIAFTDPQLALLAQEPPVGPQWIHEMKFDGYRTLARIESGEVTLQTRKGLDWTAKYRPIQRALRKLNVDNAWLDGEIVVLNGEGQSDFQLLQENIKSQKWPFIYYVFDLLALNGEDLREQPLEKRKSALKKLLSAKKIPNVFFSEHWTNPGDEVLSQCCRLGLEGVVSKDKTAPYISGRNGDWIKSKCGMGQEFVILGYTSPRGSRFGFGSLLLGAHDESGELVYTGHVGTGFNEASLRDLMKKFKPLETKTPTVSAKIPGARQVHWLQPKLVAEVHFFNWTKEKILRHPSFAGLRLDKPANEVQLDLPKVGSKSAASKKKSRSGSKKFKISHPDKILIAGLNVTKQDIAEYYDDIQKWILPHVKDRPLALVRCPDGIGKECFFQKSLHDMKPSGVFEEHVKGQKGKTENVIYLERAEGFTGLTQIGVLEIHTWQTHRQNLMKPDQLIFDLDPGSGVKWSSVAAAAFELKDLLSQLKLKSFVKTSGGKGLHVHVPIAPREDWDTVKAFAKAMAQLMSEKEPKRYLSVMSKSKRAGHIFIDYLRNGYGATAIAPYGLRARPEAGIALPLEWEEIEDIRPDQFTIKNAVKYIQKRASDPWKGYFTTKQRLRLDDLEDVES